MVNKLSITSCACIVGDKIRMRMRSSHQVSARLDQLPSGGIAYLVLEDFDLATFGNRLPLLSFEVFAEQPISTAEGVVRHLLDLKSASLTAEHQLHGIAIAGDNRGEALEQVLRGIHPAFRYPEADWLLGGTPVHHQIDPLLWALARAGLSNGSDERSAPTTCVTIRYLDPALNFAAGEKRARLPGRERLRRIELSAAMTGQQAKVIAQERLARHWEAEDHRLLDLPLSYYDIGVGDEVSCPELATGIFIVAEKRLRRSGLQLVLRKNRSDVPLAPVDAGKERGPGTLTIDPLVLAVLELPESISGSKPELGVFAAGGLRPFRSHTISVQTGGLTHTIMSADMPSAIGKLTAALGPASAAVRDWRNAVLVEFPHDPQLTSCSEEALLSGANLMWLGGEFLQFGIARPTGPGRYELSDLIRGKFDSGRMVTLPSGSTALFIHPGTFATMGISKVPIGSTIGASVLAGEQDPVSVSVTIDGQARRPWRPAHLRCLPSAGGLDLTWIRCNSEGQGWSDFVDNPVGSSKEVYQVSVIGQSGFLERQVPEARCQLTSTDLAELGPRPWTISVRQLGDLVAGNPAVITLD